MSNDRAWERYANEPNALMGIVVLNSREILRDSANEAWYREQNEVITNHVRKLLDPEA